MVKNMSCFAQVLALIPRTTFAQAVRRHQADRWTKGFSCWDQFVAMLFCQMGAAHSLREICGGLATALGKLVHLGLRRAPARSTLAYANEHRPWQVYQDIFEHLLGECRKLAGDRRRKFKFKNPLRSLDATTIDLCLSVFDWAHFRRAKGAIKLHLQLDHQGYLPCWALLTDGKRHEVKVAQKLSFAPGTIVVADAAFADFKLLNRWHGEGTFFVTRSKSNLAYRVIESRPVRGNVVRDEIIKLTVYLSRRRCPEALRRIVVHDAEHDREIIILTNIMHFAAGTIGDIYKERWQIELFFKALKQTLRVKTFVGTSANAVHIQIWTALIAMLLLKYMQFKSSLGWSLSNLAAMLRFNLLTYRDLWAWLDDPYAVPIAEPAERQLTLTFT